MNSTIRILAFLVCLLSPVTAVAQEPQFASPLRDAAKREAPIIIIQRRQLHFAATALTHEIRLEVFNKAGELVYDSGLTGGAELSWDLRNANGEAIPSGLYAYTLTINVANAEAPATRRGHLILERGRDQLWVTSEGAVGAEESPSGAELTVLSGAETTVAGAPFGRSDLRSAAPASVFNQFEAPTPGRISKFDNNLFLVNSVISEDAQGRIGIGTTTPGSKLTVAGTIETTSGGIKFPNGSVQTSAGLSQVFRNTTLTGNGTEGSPLGVNLSALNLLSAVARDTTLQGDGTTASPLGIANGGVTGQKIAAGQVVKGLNGLFDSVSLSAGANVTITPSGNGLSIAAPNVLGSVASNGTLTGNGTGASPLGVAVPLSLSGSSSGPALEIINALGTGISASGGADGRINNGAGVRAFGGNGNAGGTGVFASGGDSHSNSDGGVGIFAVGGSSDGAGGGRGILAMGGRSAGGGQAPAGEFTGDVRIFGTLSKSAGSFRIDHPLDPANKYLSHSFVESPDMKNIYDGIVRLGADGSAIVDLPEWFEALNKDFRYLLTPVGAPMPGLYIAEKVSSARFRIAGGQAGFEVSWQVTGIRQDAYANKYRIQVEEEKPERERGYYLRPEVFNQTEEKSIEWARNPELMRQIKSRLQKTELQKQGQENDR